MKKHRVVAIVGSLACAAAGAVLPSTGCGGNGFTPVCTFEDGAINAEAGCGTPVEAAALTNDSSSDSPEDQGSPVGDDGPIDSNPVSQPDASDGGGVDADAHVTDAHEDAHDAHIQDAHNDSKG